MALFFPHGNDFACVQVHVYLSICNFVSHCDWHIPVAIVLGVYERKSSVQRTKVTNRFELDAWRCEVLI